MNAFGKTTSIASRTVSYEGSDGTRHDIGVEVGAPALVSRDTWECTFQVTGFGTPILHATYGIDAMQALILALHTIPTELCALAREDGGQYLDESDLGLDHACRVHLDIAD
jgi:hypothetical protein